MKTEYNNEKSNCLHLEHRTHLWLSNYWFCDVWALHPCCYHFYSHPHEASININKRSKFPPSHFDNCHGFHVTVIYQKYNSSWSVISTWLKKKMFAQVLYTPWKKITLQYEIITPFFIYISNTEMSKANKFPRAFLAHDGKTLAAVASNETHWPISSFSLRGDREKEGGSHRL